MAPDLGNRPRHNGWVARYRCPYCEPRSLLSRQRPDGVWICLRCGDPLQRVPLWRPWHTLAGALVALGFGLAALPPLLTLPRSAEPLPQPVATLLPAPRPAGLEGLEPTALLARLSAADAAWTPRAEHLPDGRIRYHYRRRQGDRELSLDQVRALIDNPPTFAMEQSSIAELLDLLAAAGVRIQLTQPRKAGAAGEWDPRSRSLRIKPSLLERGSREFAHVLNHEAIHVAQSCRGGGIRARPHPLGLPEQLPPPLQGVLSEPVYRLASPIEQRLEREAYANQHRLDLGPLLLRSHCRLTG